MITQKIELMEIIFNDANQLRYPLVDNIAELKGKKITRIDYFDDNINCFCVNGIPGAIGIPTSHCLYITIVDMNGKKILNRLPLQTMNDTINQNNRYNLSVIPDYSKSFVELAPGTPFIPGTSTLCLAFHCEENAPQIDWKKRLRVYKQILNTNDIQDGKLYFKNNAYLNGKKIRQVMLLDEDISPNGKTLSTKYYPIVLTKLVGGVEQQLINKYYILGLKDQYQNDKNEIVFDDIVFEWDKSYLLITDNNFDLDKEYTFNIYYTD